MSKAIFKIKSESILDPIQYKIDGDMEELIDMTMDVMPKDERVASLITTASYRYSLLKLSIQNGAND